MSTPASRVAAAYLSRTAYSQPEQVKSFLEYLEKAKKSHRTLKKGPSTGPYQTSVTDTEMVTVDLSDWMGTLPDAEAALDHIAHLLNRDRRFDTEVAKALGIWDRPYFSIRGVHNRERPADYEILDENFSAVYTETLWMN